MPPFPHAHAISNRAAIWMAPRNGGCPGATQSGAEVERVLESTIMRPNENQNLERILESAVVVSWADLMRGAQSGLIHIEYGFATLDYLQVWSSITRGHWLLACAYWTSASKFHDTGVHFDNGYQSESLAHILEVVMQHQNAFALPPNLGRQGLLQITTPTEEESTPAAAALNEAFDRLGSPLAEPVPA
jgi:hypothetical protein